MIGYIVKNPEGKFGEALIYKHKLSKKKEEELLNWITKKYGTSCGYCVRSMTQAEIKNIMLFGKALIKYKEKDANSA